MSAKYSEHTNALRHSPGLRSEESTAVLSEASRPFDALWPSVFNVIYHNSAPWPEGERGHAGREGGHKRFFFYMQRLWNCNYLCAMTAGQH